MTDGQPDRGNCYSINIALCIGLSVLCLRAIKISFFSVRLLLVKLGRYNFVKPSSVRESSQPVVINPF